MSLFRLCAVLAVLLAPIVDKTPALQQHYTHIHAWCHDRSQQLWRRLASVKTSNIIQGKPRACMHAASHAVADGRQSSVCRRA